MTVGDPRFLAALDEVRAMHMRKSEDYGSSLSGDPLANIRASEDYGIPAWIGAMIRAGDKVHRIKEFARKGSLANEGVKDSLLDLAAYALIAYVLYMEVSDGDDRAMDRGSSRDVPAHNNGASACQVMDFSRFADRSHS